MSFKQKVSNYKHCNFEGLKKSLQKLAILLFRERLDKYYPLDDNYYDRYDRYDQEINKLTIINLLKALWFNHTSSRLKFKNLN